MSEKNVGWELHHNVTDEEKGDRRGVLGRGQIETLGHPGDLCGRDIVLLSHGQTSARALLEITAGSLCS